MILFVICLWQSRRDIAQSLVSIGILPGNLFHTKQLVTFYRVAPISKNDTHCGCQLFKDFPAESFEASWQQESNVLKDSRMWTLSPNLSAEAYIEQGENPVNAWPLLVRDLFWVGPPFVAASLPREHARPGLDVRTKRDVTCLVTIKQRMTHKLRRWFRNPMPGMDETFLFITYLEATWYSLKPKLAFFLLVLKQVARRWVQVTLQPFI